MQPVQISKEKAAEILGCDTSVLGVICHEGYNWRIGVDTFRAQLTAPIPMRGKCGDTISFDVPRTFK